MEQDSRAPLHPIATVLAPTDFSDESFRAMRYAAALVAKFGAKLHVVHVSEIDFASPGAALPGRDLMEGDSESVRLIRQQLGTVSGEPVPASLHGRTGRAFDQICRFAREIEADLIVMSTHGRTGLKRLFLGSNAERVVQHSSVPVLVVRQNEPAGRANAEPLQIKTILVPIDFSESSREGLNYAVEFARQFGARLVLLHSFNIPELITTDHHATYIQRPTPEEARTAAENKMREYLNGVPFSGVAYEIQITTGHPAEGICDYAETKNIDLIVTSTHGRTGFMHVLIGSTAEHIVRYARSSVLVVPAMARKTE